MARNTYVCLDPGSTHCGQEKYCYDLIDVAAEIHANAIKFQMFPNTPEYTKGGNIPLPYIWMKKLVEYGKNRRGRRVDVTASVFDKAAVEEIIKHEVPFVKFSYAKQSELDSIEALLRLGRRVVVSTDQMHIHDLPDHPNLIKLFCQPVYPTYWQTNFDGLFPPFDGFSDHSLGIEESIRAANHGAMWIEKHIRLAYDDCGDCPDGKFALMPKAAAEMIRRIRGLDPPNEEVDMRGVLL